MIAYKTNSYSTKINVVEVEKFTTCFAVLKNGSKERLHTEYSRWFITFEAARQHMIESRVLSASGLRIRATKIDAEIIEIMRMTE
jgi:hypothetical protein